MASGWLSRLSRFSRKGGVNYRELLYHFKGVKCVLMWGFHSGKCHSTLEGSMWAHTECTCKCEGAQVALVDARCKGFEGAVLPISTQSDPAR
jgi:hypothetical protein